MTAATATAQPTDVIRGRIDAALAAIPHKVSATGWRSSSNPQDMLKLVALATAEEWTRGLDPAHPNHGFYANPGSVERRCRMFTYRQTADAVREILTAVIY